MSHESPHGLPPESAAWSTAMASAMGDGIVPPQPDAQTTDDDDPRDRLDDEAHADLRDGEADSDD